jgi:hypothetical protein
LQFLLPAFFVRPETLIAVYVGCIFCSCRNIELEAVFYLWFCDEDQELYYSGIELQPAAIRSAGISGAGL